MKLISRWLVALFVVGLLSSFASAAEDMKTLAVADPNADFSKYKTYGWAKVLSTQPDDPRISEKDLDNRIHKTVDAQLAAKGLKLVTSEKPDLFIAYHAALKSKIDVSGSMSAYYQNSYRDDSLAKGTGAMMRNVDEGSLVIDMIDTNTMQAVWRGSAQARVNVSASDEAKDKLMAEAVGKMMADFPPKK